MFQDWKKQLTTAERSVLNYTYNSWKNDLKWPKSVKLEVECRDKFEENEDLFMVLSKLEGTFVEFDDPNDKTGHTKLSIFGIALCDNSKEDLDDFLLIIQYLAKKYIEDPNKDDFHIEEILDYLDIDKNKNNERRIIHLISTSKNILRSYNTNGSSFSLDSRVWKFENVKTIDEYFKKTGRKTPERFLNADNNDLEMYINKKDGSELNSSKNNVCFVISPIGKEGTENHKKFKDVLDYIIKPAIDDSEFELKLLRADDIKRPGSWIKDILLNIYNSYIVIADLTGQNPNVFYELGVRHALSPRTILISQSIDDIPSDLDSYRTIIYEMSHKGPKKFKDVLSAYLDEIYEDPNRPDNPVLDKLGVLENNNVQILENQNNDLKKEINQLKNAKKPHMSKNLDNADESIVTRIRRIFKIKKIKREASWEITERINSNTYKSLGYLPSNHGDFRLYVFSEYGYVEEFYYFSFVLDLNLKKELADIRVLMTEADKGRNIQFVIVTNEDLSGIKSEINNKFDKMKEFIDENSRDLFSLQVWDDETLTEMEKELGIII